MNRGARSGLFVGLVLCAVIGLGLATAPQDLTGVKGLALVVPVVVACILGGRRAAYPTALASAFAFALVLPPVGSFRVLLAADLLALVTFAAVAVIVGEIVARNRNMLRLLDEQRSSMLRSVSHDLRTPLSSIKAASSELLSDHPHDEATVTRLLELVNKESDRLDRLVANLLDHSRIEAGGLRPNLQSVDLREVANVVATRMHLSLGDTRLDIAIDEGLEPITADFVMLEQLLTNLIDNAVRHSPPGGVVTISASDNGAAVTLTVSDEGSGVSAELTNVLFEPFTSSRPGGGGIGLAICRAIVETHGGTITFREAPGGGATFVATLPRN